MAVGVVGAQRDERDRGPGGCQELRIGVPAAVVGHLEHVGPQVDALAHQPFLRLRTEVTGEQQPQPADGHPDDQGQVVGRRFGGCGGPARARREHLQDRSPELAPVAGHQDRPGRAGAAHEDVQGGGAVVGG